MEVRTTLGLLAIATMACKSPPREQRNDGAHPHVHDPDEPVGYHRPDVELQVRITATGLDPTAPHVTAGALTSLVVTRTSDKACAKTVLVYFSGGTSVYRGLALDKPESFTGTFDTSGTLTLECEHDVGKLFVEPSSTH